MGVSARQQATTNVKNTVSCFKRLLGRKYQDQQVQDEIKNFPKPYTVVEGKTGETLIQVISHQNFTHLIFYKYIKHK